MARINDSHKQMRNERFIYTITRLEALKNMQMLIEKPELRYNCIFMFMDVYFSESFH